MSGGEEGADGDAEAHDGLHDGALRKIHAERVVAPLENEELKHCASAPEERRDGEGDLTETVTPEKTAALDEALDGVDGVELLRGIAHARVGNGEVDGRGGEVDEGDREDGGLGKARQAESIKMEQIEDGLCDLRLDENTAEHNAENDGTNREALDPAVGDNELLRREKLGENAVLRGRVGRSAHAHDRVGEKWVAAEEHQQAADRLDEVRQEHDAALGHRVCEDAHPGGEAHVAHHEKELEERRHPVRSVDARQKGDGSDEQCVVGQRRQELRAHDGIEAAVHKSL